MDVGWLTWLWIIPVLGLLVFVHELGHFVTARMNGIRVDEFGFGYPPRLFGIKRKGVVYSINLLPLGGFVRIHGENGENQDDPDAFGSKAPWRRAIVLVAGSFMNIVLALVIFVMLAMIGIPSARGAQIDAVSPGSPAALAGFRLGDEVKTIAGVAISTPEDIADAVAANLDKPTTVVLLRNGQEVGATVTPRSRPPANQGAMGVTIGAAEIIKTRYNPVEAVWVGVQRTLSTTLLMVEGVSHLIGTLITTGSVSGVAGPVGIAQVTSEIAKQGQFEVMLSWTALLSLNLFLINLLPLPALDGGRLVFVLLEWVRRKKIAPQREALVHAAGMIMLLMLMLIISFFDVQRVISGGSILPTP